MAKTGDTARSEGIGVVTVSYGSESVLPAFLRSIEQSSSLRVTAVVADNRPELGQASEIAKAASAVYVPLPSNPGYGAAVNAAVAALPLTIKWVLVSNPDVVLEPGVLDALLAVATTHPSIASVGPAVFNDDGSLYPSARAVPSLRTGIGHAMFVNLWPGNPWSKRYRHDDDSSPVRRDAGWLSGSCLLVRRSAFEEVGGFDEGYFMYFEDVDLGYRFGRQGYRNVYEPTARVTHAGAHSTTSDSERMIAAHHTSARRFLAKKYSGPLLWPVRVVLNVGLSLRSAIVGQRVRKQGALRRRQSVE